MSCSRVVVSFCANILHSLMPGLILLCLQTLVFLNLVWVRAFGCMVAEFKLLGNLFQRRECQVLKIWFLFLERLFAGADELGVEMVVRTESGYPAAVAETLPLVLPSENPGQFSIETVADLRHLRFGVSQDSASFVAVLSFILLLFATVSASTTMYLSVQARSVEIALRRAIGAKRFDIARLFVVEGICVGIIWGCCWSCGRHGGCSCFGDEPGMGPGAGVVESILGGIL